MNEMMASIEINIYWSNLSPVYCSIASPSHNINHYKFDRPRYLAAYKITLDPAHLRSRLIVHVNQSRQEIAKTIWSFRL